MPPNNNSNPHQQGIIFRGLSQWLSLIRLQNQKKDYTDVILKCQNGSFRVHSIVLQARCDPSNPLNLTREKNCHHVIDATEFSVETMARYVFLYYLGMTEVMKSTCDTATKIFSLLHANQRSVTTSRPFLLIPNSQLNPASRFGSILAKYQSCKLRCTMIGGLDYFISFNGSFEALTQPQILSPPLPRGLGLCNGGANYIPSPNSSRQFVAHQLSSTVCNEPQALNHSDPRKAYKCKICSSDKIFTAPGHLDHVVKEHKLIRGEHYKLRKIPTCILCGCDDTTFQEDPSEFTLHVYKCLQAGKLPIKRRFNKTTYAAIVGSNKWYEEMEDVPPQKSIPDVQTPTPFSGQGLARPVVRPVPVIIISPREAESEDPSSDDLRLQRVTPAMLSHLPFIANREE